MLFKQVSLGCHGMPERCFKVAGKRMTFCARCLGASIGHISAAVNFFFTVMPPNYFAVIGLTIMFGDWYMQNTFKLYHSNFARLFTGAIGGYSVGILIWAGVKECQSIIL